MPKSSIAESCGRSIVSILRSHNNNFHSGFRSLQQSINIFLTLNPTQLPCILLILAILIEIRWNLWFSFFSYWWLRTLNVSLSVSQWFVFNPLRTLCLVLWHIFCSFVSWANVSSCRPGCPAVLSLDQAHFKIGIFLLLPHTSDD